MKLTGKNASKLKMAKDPYFKELVDKVWILLNLINLFLYKCSFYLLLARDVLDCR